MAEWLYEDGIGERRALLVDGGQIVEARVERDSDGARVGGIHDARLLSRRDRIARLASGEEVIVAGKLPSQGSALRVEIVRTAIPERDLVKRAKAAVVTDPAKPATPGTGATLYDSIALHHGPPRRVGAHESDAFEAAGWSELLDAALSGVFPFAGGIARLALTPAMAVFDIDGAIGGVDLARVGAVECARICRLLGIGGNIVIDLPTIRSRADRALVGEAFDAALDDDSDTIRLPVNPLGLLHASRPRRGPSLAERLRYRPVESAALALLRRAERVKGHGDISVTAHPAVAQWLEDRPGLTATLTRRTGRPTRLQADPARAIWAGDVQ